MTISFDSLLIFERYNGDSDMFARLAKPAENAAMGYDEKIWLTIDSAIQNIHIIATGLESKEFILKTVASLKASADDKAFNSLMHRIPFYKGFKELAAILEKIKEMINTEIELKHTRGAAVGELLAETEKNIAELLICDYKALDRARAGFGPLDACFKLLTQDKWDKEYQELSKQFMEISLSLA